MAHCLGLLRSASPWAVLHFEACSSPEQMLLAVPLPVQVPGVEALEGAAGRGRLLLLRWRSAAGRPTWSGAPGFRPCALEAPELLLLLIQLRLPSLLLRLVDSLLPLQLPLEELLSSSGGHPRALALSCRSPAAARAAAHRPRTAAGPEAAFAALQRPHLIPQLQLLESLLVQPLLTSLIDRNRSSDDPR